MKEGSVFGGTLLVAGCSIGAGMLGLPIITAQVGFFPSFWVLLLTWGYMCSTGLLLLEVNLWYPDEISIVSMAERTLGFVGKVVGFIVFLFLFYSLMVAYVGGSGTLFSDFFEQVSAMHVPSWVGSLFFVLFFGFLIYLGTFVVDEFNRLLMLGLIISYILLVFVGISRFDANRLTFQDWSRAPYVLPIMIVLFGYHNLVPTLTEYLKHDKKRLIWTIVFGSLIPFFIYILWEAIILGLIPLEGETGLKSAMAEGEMATKVLRNAVGSLWVVDLAEYFAFFALATSFLGVALSFVDFLADAIHIPKVTIGKLILCFLVLGLPFICSVFYPNVFLGALQYAGFAAVILFGLLPVAMVWVGRYSLNKTREQILPGGRLSLLVITFFSFAVMGYLIYDKIGLK